jgi:CubicO group peptidase (beta-lactamase class C family)
MIASNTKGLTTLLLAKLVDEGKIGWKDADRAGVRGG